MQSFLLLLSVMVATVQSICSGSTYWNPLNNACVNQCPWVSPNLYYADPSTNQCVITCPTTPSLYANDLLQTCVNRNYSLIQLALGLLLTKHSTMTLTAAAS